MRGHFFGRSTFLVEVPGARLVIDPNLSVFPRGPVAPADVPCDYVRCSHAHEDHSCDALELARLHRAMIVAPYELASILPPTPRVPRRSISCPAAALICRGAGSR